VRFATAHEPIQVEVIEPIKVPTTRKEMHEAEQVKRNNLAYKTAPSKVSVADLTITKRDSLSMHGTCGGGIVPYVEPKVTKGSGEYDPYVLKQRDDDNDYHRKMTYMLYIKAEMAKMRDMNTVDCYA
jgi:hypothetical protein